MVTWPGPLSAPHFLPSSTGSIHFFIYTIRTHCVIFGILLLAVFGPASVGHTYETRSRSRSRLQSQQALRGRRLRLNLLAGPVAEPLWMRRRALALLNQVSALEVRGQVDMRALASLPRGAATGRAAALALRSCATGAAARPEPSHASARHADGGHSAGPKQVALQWEIPPGASHALTSRDSGR